MDSDLHSLLRGAGLHDLIKIPKPAFIKEHKKLIKLLRTSDDPRFQAEANDQAAELKKMVDGMVGASKKSGFIQRMMWEVKHKHKGTYKTPTYPLAPDSKMNAEAEFEYKKLANAAQDGENEAKYGASPFIRRHFGTVKAVVRKVGRPGRSDTDRDRVRALWNEDKSRTTRDIVKLMKDKHDVVISQPTVARILKDIRPKFDLKGALARDKEKARAEVAAMKEKKAAKEATPAPSGRVTIPNEDIRRAAELLKKASATPQFKDSSFSWKKEVERYFLDDLRDVIKMKKKGTDSGKPWDIKVGWIRRYLAVWSEFAPSATPYSPEEKEFLKEIGKRFEAWSKQPPAVKSP